MMKIKYQAASVYSKCFYIFLVYLKFGHGLFLTGRDLTRCEDQIFAGLL